MYKQHIMFVFLFSIKSLLTDLSVGACVVISQFFGPYQGSGSLFSRSVPWDPSFFSVDLTRLGGLLAWAVKKKKLPEHTAKSVSRKVFLPSRWPHSKKVEEH